ncbi:MAG: hypothetical protein LBT97_11920, partial [Planctomycetota bacterium]|nr:hypothetical protein [Planctomycetota bacterium]
GPPGTPGLHLLRTPFDEIRERTVEHFFPFFDVIEHHPALRLRNIVLLPGVGVIRQRLFQFAAGMVSQNACAAGREDYFHVRFFVWTPYSV